MINIDIFSAIGILLATTTGALLIGFHAGKALMESKITKKWTAADYAAFRDWKRMLKNSRSSIIEYINQSLHHSKTTILLYQKQLADINRKRFGLDDINNTNSIVKKTNISSRRNTNTLNNVIKFPSSD